MIPVAKTLVYVLQNDVNQLTTNVPIVYKLPR